jgi:hypothetical protein
MMRSSVPPETAERRQQLRQSDGVDVRYIPDVYVQIAADCDRALVNDQGFKYVSQLDRKMRRLDARIQAGKWTETRTTHRLWTDGSKDIRTSTAVAG